jgi:hypothetical protein
VVAENTAERESCIRGRKDGSRNLIEQRLELPVVIAIEESDTDVFVRSQFDGALQSGEASADDNDLGFVHEFLMAARLLSESDTEGKLGR